MMKIQIRIFLMILIVAALAFSVSSQCVDKREVKAVYATLTVDQQIDAWRSHIDRTANTLPLTSLDRQLVGEVKRATLNREFFTLSAEDRDRTFAPIKTRLQQRLSGETAWKLFVDLQFVDVERFIKKAPAPIVVNEGEGLPYCNCLNSWGGDCVWTWGWYCRTDTASHCNQQGTYCGFMWFDSCNGICKPTAPPLDFTRTP